MKIAFFTDIHGNKYVLDGFFSLTARHAVDLIVFCGDAFGYYYHTEEILNRFRACANLVCIKGNHDRRFLDLLDGRLNEQALVSRFGNSYAVARQTVSARNVAYVKSWPEQWEYSVDGLRLAAFHGSPAGLDDRVYPDTPLHDETLFAGYTHVVLGHTHHKMERRLPGGCLVLNPGSIGQQRDGKGCSCIILDTASGRYSFHTVEYDVRLLRSDVEQHDPGNTTLIEVLYRER